MIPQSDAIEHILGSYSYYYDINRINDDELIASMTFHSSGEKYILTKKATLWSENNHEYVFLYFGDILTTDKLDSAITYSLKEALKQINPDKNHRCSSVTTILIYNTVEESAVRNVKRYSYHKSFKFMFNGWMEHRIAVVSYEDKSIISSKRCKDVRKNLSEILCSD